MDIDLTPGTPPAWREDALRKALNERRLHAWATLGQRLNAWVREIIAGHRLAPLVADRKAQADEILARVLQ